MKKTYDTRKLCEGIARTINIPDSYDSYYKQWKEAFVEAVGRQPDEFEAFYAGYIMSNPSVRDLYKMYGGKERDEKIELHRNDAFN